MLLFPYRAQIKLHKWPVMTIAVSVVCLLVYVAQSQSEARLERYADRFCSEIRPSALPEGDAAAAEKAPAVVKPTQCQRLLLHIRYDSDPRRHLAWHVEQLRRQHQESLADLLEQHYPRFAERAPTLLTAYLWHNRSRIDFAGMITSSFAHGSWEHVIGNLIFFFAFAATVELLIGPVLFMAAVFVLSLGIGLFDHFMAHWQADPIPGLGLSGVVMGMLGLFVYFLPHAKIRFFFWFMLSIGTIGVPAWIVAVWYFGWDLYYQMSQAGGHVNFVAHLVGAALGLLIGVTVFREKRHWAKELVLETVDLTKDETWFSKLNGIMVAPVVAGLAFVTGLLVLTVVVMVIERIGWVLLLASPAMLAAYQIYRSKRAERPLRETYQLGVDAMGRQEWESAHRLLAPLAEKNDARALVALANLHSTASGAWRDDVVSADLLRRAAERGNAVAQYRYATRLVDGRGVVANAAAANEWYEKAANAGVADAANSLAYRYENGVGIGMDRERAIEWYYKAAVGFHRERRREDAQAVVRHLESLATKYPAVIGLIAKLRGLMNVVRA